MLFLWVFADNIEATVGNLSFLIFYTLGGLAAHAAHIYFNWESDIPTIGASGAISAVMGAYLVMFPTSRVKVLFLIFPFRIHAFIFLGLWIFQQLNSGFASLDIQTAETAGVAWWAHIGGFIFGILAGLYYRMTGRMHGIKLEGKA
jgi:membrane associated rhomboid family serine protease